MKRPSPGRRAPLDMEAVRRELRELGYLAGPLSQAESWVLAGSGGTSTLLGVNAMASLRVGAIGGPLLGIPAAVVVTLANRPHLTSLRDQLLLALYASAVLGAVLACLEFATDMALGWLARRGLVLLGAAEKLAARVGFLFAAAATLYLAFLMRGGRLGSASDPEAADAGLGGWALWGGAILVALLVGHVIGRLSRLGSLSILAAASAAGALAWPARSSSSGARQKKLALGLSAALLLVAGLLVFSPKENRAVMERRPTVPSGITPAAVPGRVVLIGVDGLDVDSLRSCDGDGSCPTLARLQAEGALYAMTASEPRVPPAIWTTIATGQPQAEHGVLGYQADWIPGLSRPLQHRPERSSLSFSLKLLIPSMGSAGRSPVSSRLRREPAVWEILSSTRTPSAAVNWWATWPAAEQDGIIVSERAFPRLASGREPRRDIAPRRLEKELAGTFRKDMSEAREAAAKAGLDLSSDRVVSPAMIDGYHALVARRILSSESVKLLLLYLPGLDIGLAREGSLKIDEGSEEHRGLLRHTDAIVASFAGEMKPDDILLVAGHPGRSREPGGPVAAHGSAEEPRAGLLLAWGRRVEQGMRALRASPHDIAPTLLALTGLPAARDMPGSPALDFLRPGDPVVPPPGSIPSYGARSETTATEAQDPFDPEMIERLRSLGYIR